LVTPS